jgi:hypothetical protein
LSINLPVSSRFSNLLGYKFSNYFLMIFRILLLPVVILSFSSVILLIWIFLLLLDSVDKSLPLLFVFEKKQLFFFNFFMFNFLKNYLFFIYLFLFTYLHVHTLGHFFTLPPSPTLPPSLPQFQAGPVLPLSLILLKKGHMHNMKDKTFLLVELRMAIQKESYYRKKLFVSSICYSILMSPFH